MIQRFPYNIFFLISEVSYNISYISRHIYFPYYFSYIIYISFIFNVSHIFPILFHDRCRTMSNIFLRFARKNTWQTVAHAWNTSSSPSGVGLPAPEISGSVRFMGLEWEYHHPQEYNQWPFQEPKLEVPTIYKAYCSGLNFRGYTPNIWPNIWY